MNIQVENDSAMAQMLRVKEMMGKIDEISKWVDSEFGDESGEFYEQADKLKGMLYKRAEGILADAMFC